jgi:hypothetical protein
MYIKFDMIISRTEIYLKIRLGFLLFRMGTNIISLLL